MKSEKSTALSLLFLILFFLHCAKEGMPPGGPVDTTPPEVISVSPKPDSTTVDLNSKIEIIFSERMSDKPTEEAIFVSPFPKEPFDFKWQGRKLLISPSEPLLKDRTYVVTIGTDAQDLRNNRMSQSYTFAFSTGSSLDYCTISGEVWVKQKIGFGKEHGVSVWAYRLALDKMEIDPEKEKPDYITQTDEEGKYSLLNLGLGKYRLFAILDANRDMLWNWEGEAIGVTTQDVELTEQDKSKSFVDFIIEKKDKHSPSLLNCQSLNMNLVKLEFDEELEERSVLDFTNYKVSSTSTQKPLKVISVFYQETGTRTVFLLTEAMNPGEEYMLEGLAVKDKAGNPLDTVSNTCLFDGSGIPDTTGPKVTSIFPEEGEINVPLDTKIRLTFNQPPDPQGVDTSFFLVDSNGVKIPGTYGWQTPNSFIFSPDSLLSGKMQYKIKLLGQSIRNMLGNTAMSDSIIASSFVTLNPDTLGSVSGKVKIDKEDTIATVNLSLWQIEPGGSSYQITLLRSGSFLFERIHPGKYFLGGYVDLNKDENLTLGQPEPFSPLEPFSLFPDTIYVRSRWETEGVELEFR